MMESTADATVVGNASVQQPQPRMRRPHRPRKDYTNLDTVFDSLDDLKTALRHYMDNAITEDALPRYVSCAMTLSPHTLLHLKSPLEGPYAQGGPNHIELNAPSIQVQEVDEENAYKSVLELVNIDDLKQRQIWQRAAAKGVVHQIQALDGFKYCFNNNWTSKDDNGYRYSYTCLDSLENKDRHANGFRPTNTATRRPNANSRGVRKPTYDCKGQIAVKFSGNRQIVEVVYKHHAIHKTVAERRPPPRKDARRRAAAAQSNAEASPENMQHSFADIDPQDAPFMFDDADPADFQAFSEPVEPEPVEPAPVEPAPVEPPPAAKKKRAPRKAKDTTQQPPKKRQKTQPAQSAQPTQPNQLTRPAQSMTTPDRPLSLAEILQQSMAPEPPAHPGPTSRLSQPASMPAAPNHVTDRQSNPSPYHQGQPRDVGRYSKLPVPCFKCKATHTECDGMPVCNSCSMRGTVCNYPSILRFDKTPLPDKRWIQGQPTPPMQSVPQTHSTQTTHPGRGVFRINQVPTSASQTNNPFAQGNAWYPQQQ